ncbi:MAG: tetratricopeptide repeat protein [Helicobacteraceae bacterium]
MKAFLFIFSALTIVFAETSVLKNSSLEAKKKYGLTENEQYIYDNKKDIDLLRNRIFKLEQNSNDTSSEQDGLKTLVITNSKKMSAIEKNQNLYDEQIKILQNENKHLQETIKEMSSLIAQLKKQTDLLSKSYVTGKEIKEISNRLLKEINKNKEHINDLARALEIKKPEAAFNNKSSDDIFKDIKKFIKNKKFDSARTRIAYLLDKEDYLKPRAFYLLGQLEYNSKNYENAVRAFNASGKLDPDADYMPNLLFYAAVSYENLGQKENAKKYLEMLIDTYPKNSLTKNAKTRLTKLS